MRQSSGQSTAEYAILISVVIAALVGMQVYVRRGLNARWKDVSDSASRVVAEQVGRDGTAVEYRQYEPYYAASDYDVVQHTRQPTIVKEARGGVMTRENIDEETTRQGTEDLRTAIK